MNVSANLLEYLKKNDSAELIGIGTFRVNYIPASISPITNTLTPPSRSITFYNEFNEDLGFVQELAKKEFISVDTAMKWVKQYCDSVKEKIETSNTCKLGDIGSISKGFKGGYAFTPTEGLNLLDSTFAFSTIKSVKTFDQGDYIQPIITKEPLKEEPIIETPKIQITPTQRVIIGTSDQNQQPTENASDNIIEQKREQIFENQSQLEEEKTLNLTHEKTKDIVFEEREAIERDASQMQEAQKEVEERLRKRSEEKEEELGETEGLDIDDKDAFNYKNSRKFRKNTKRQLKVEKKERKKRRKRNKIVWRVLFVLVLLALLASVLLVFAHYMCWTRNIKTLDPITEKLNNYITPKCENSQVTIVIPVVTPTTEIVETPTTETVTQQIVEQPQQTPVPTKKATQPKQIVKKEQPLKPTGEKDNPPAPTVEIDYSTPILMQPVSRLGFDVVGGTFENVSNAQQAARKARSLGYDSYIISKTSNDQTKYYVSYGSRRTMREANDFLSKINKKHGSSGYYIISR